MKQKPKTTKPEEVTLRQLQAEARLLRQQHFPEGICFVSPVNTKPISVTGADCELDCAHCGGHYLKNMLPLHQVAGDPGGSSLLISGGCSREGKVPLEPHWEKLASLKQGKKVNVHTGLVTEADAARLQEIADVVSFDFIVDDTAAQAVYGLNKTAADFRHSYRLLRKYVKTVPHICIGLAGSPVTGEYQALARLAEDGADALVFIVFTPTKGTRCAGFSPPRPAEAARLMAAARIMFPTIPIHLGCMRPPGQYRSQLDVLALDSGINTIVHPAPAVQEKARKLGLEIYWQKECCVL